MDCSPPVSSVHGILWARILECVAIPFSSGSSQPRDWTWVPCIAGRFFTIWATRVVLGLRGGAIKGKQQSQTISPVNYPCLVMGNTSREGSLCEELEIWIGAQETHVWSSAMIPSGSHLQRLSPSQFPLSPTYKSWAVGGFLWDGAREGSLTPSHIWLCTVDVLVNEARLDSSHDFDTEHSADGDSGVARLARMSSSFYTSVLWACCDPPTPCRSHLHPSALGGKKAFAECTKSPALYQEYTNPATPVIQLLLITEAISVIP